MCEKKTRLPISTIQVGSFKEMTLKEKISEKESQKKLDKFEEFLLKHWKLELIKQNIIPDIRTFRTKWETKVLEILNEATLSVDFSKARQLTGGKDGKHTEKMGYILAEMQVMQRTYPNMEW